MATAGGQVDHRGTSHRVDVGATGLLWAYVACAFCYLVFAVGRHDWFSGQGGDWNLLAGPASRDVFLPVEQHWTTVPILLYQGYLRIFGLEYFPFVVTVVVAHLGIVILLWLVMRRVGVRPWVAGLAAAALVLFSPGYLSMVMPIQITQNLSLLCGLGQVLLADHEGTARRRDAFALGLGAVGVMSSGLTPVLVVAIGVALLLRRGWRAAAVQTVPLGVLYLGWAVLAKPTENSQIYQTDVYDLGTHVDFVWAGLSHSFGALGGWSVIGVALALMLVVGLTVRVGQDPRAEIVAMAVPLSLLGASVLYLAIVGYQRSALHPEYAYLSHHMYTVVALSLPALACAADALVDRWRLAAPAVVALMCVGIVSNVRFDDSDRLPNLQSSYLLEQRDLLVSTARSPDLDHRRQVDPDGLVYPRNGFLYTAWVTYEWLAEQRDAGRVPGA